MSQLISEESDRDSQVVQQPTHEGLLLLGGSFNPCHTQHIELLNQIKIFLELHYSIDIIAGILVISTDRYVFRKLYNNGIKFQYRRRICELTSSKHDWIHSSHIGKASPPFYGEILTNATVNNTYKQSRVQFNNMIDLQSKIYSKLHQKTLNKMTIKEKQSILQFNCFGADKIDALKSFLPNNKNNATSKNSNNSNKPRGRMKYPNLRTVVMARKEYNDKMTQYKDKHVKNTIKNENEQKGSDEKSDCNVNNMGDVVFSKSMTNLKISKKNERIKQIPKCLFIENECLPVSSTQIRQAMFELESNKIDKKQFAEKMNTMLAKNVIDCLCDLFLGVNDKVTATKQPLNVRKEFYLSEKDIKMPYSKR